MKEHKIGCCWLNNCHKQTNAQDETTAHSRAFKGGMRMLHFQDKLSVSRAESFKYAEDSTSSYFEGFWSRFWFYKKTSFSPTIYGGPAAISHGTVRLNQITFHRICFQSRFLCSFHLTCYSFKNQITKSSEPFHYIFKSRERGEKIKRKEDSGCRCRRAFAEC